MKKTTVYTTLMLLLCLAMEVSAQEDSRLSHEFIIKFNNTASPEFKANLKEELNATVIYTAPNLNVETWKVDHFPIETFDDINDEQYHLENIAQVVGYTHTKAEVDQAETNKPIFPEPMTLTEFISDMSLPEYDPIAGCNTYPGSIYCSGGSNAIKIGIIDTGVDDNNPWLSAYISGKYNVINNSQNVDDHNGHGTEIASILAGELSATGLSQTSMHIVKAFDANGQAYLSDIIAGVINAYTNNVDVIVASWGYTPNPNTIPPFGNNPYSSVLQSILQIAAANDVITVAAAGNQNLNLDNNAYHPADFNTIPNLITVSATDCDGAKAGFSNFGLGKVEIGAPGVDIVCQSNNQFWYKKSGSSYAVPVVVGAIAQVASKMQSFEADEIYCRLISSVQGVNSLYNLVSTGGVLNVDAACTSNCSSPNLTQPNENEQTVQEWQDDQINVFPNPFEDILTIEFDETAITGSVQISLYNQYQQKVYSRTEEVEAGYDLKSFELRQPLSSGVYWLVISDNKHSITKKVLKL